MLDRLRTANVGRLAMILGGLGLVLFAVVGSVFLLPQQAATQQQVQTTKTQAQVAEDIDHAIDVAGLR